MKKNLLVACLFVLSTLLSFSQSLVLIDSVAGQLTNGAVIYKTGINSPDGEIIQHLAVKNISSNDIPVMVKKTMVDTVIGSSNVFCWGICFGPYTYISPESISVPAGTTNALDFSGHYLPTGIAGATTVRYTFYAERDLNDSVCVNVVYMAFPLGTEELDANVTALSNAYPNPATDKVNFNFSIPAGGKGNLIVRNVLGSKIREIALNGISGKMTIPISNLEEGVYFCTLELGGNAMMTRKMVIRR